jgi:glucose/arabinose dehydrogenase
LALMVATPATATVVIDPFPRVRGGTSANIALFTDLPNSRANCCQRTGAQGMKPLADGSGRLFINDNRGILYVTDRTGTTARPYLDLRSRGIGFIQPNTQTGLMSFAFHPNFNKNPDKPGYNLLYTIDTTAPSAGVASWGSTSPVSHHNVLREWTVDDPAATSPSFSGMREVLRVAQPHGDHGAGTIAFNASADESSADYGKLYVGFGDGGGVNDPHDNAQNLASPFGKILRIDPTDPDGAGALTYTVPTDNPFAGDANARGEVWAYGLRNPQHFSWDADGRMLIVDIGEAFIEEVNRGQAGANYGWPMREGSFARSPDKSDESIFDLPANDGSFVDPIAEYDHEEIQWDGVADPAAISGAFVYEGSLIPALIGKVVLTDLPSGRVFYFNPDVTAGPLRELELVLGGAAATMRDLEGYNATDRVDLRMGLDQDGEIYFLTKAEGHIYRFASTPVPEPATWALALIGFGAVGAALRRRRLQTA